MYVIHAETSGIHCARCDAGHEIKTIVARHHVEILFESGLEAFCDGYYREAFAAFMGSYERLLEFSSRVMMLGHGVTDEGMENAWKIVSALSERQLGMFTALSTVTNGEPPKILSSKISKLRNDIIHNGKFPTRSETASLGTQVYEIINDQVLRLSGRFEMELWKIINEYIDHAKATESGAYLSASGTSVRLTAPQTESFEEILEMARGRLEGKKHLPFAAID
jgi:hypothetical protein